MLKDRTYDLDRVISGWDLLPQIRHIVILMRENHSYDNYLGLLTGQGEGLPLGSDVVPTAINFLPNGRR